MLRRSRKMRMLAGAALVAACTDADALTSPTGDGASRGVRRIALRGVFEGAPPAGFPGQVAGLGGTIEWVHRRGRGVGGLRGEAAVSLLRTRGVPGCGGWSSEVADEDGTGRDPRSDPAPVLIVRPRGW